MHHQNANFLTGIIFESLQLDFIVVLLMDSIGFPDFSRSARVSSAASFCQQTPFCSLRGQQAAEKRALRQPAVLPRQEEHPATRPTTQKGRCSLQALVAPITAVVAAVFISGLWRQLNDVTFDVVNYHKET